MDMRIVTRKVLDSILEIYYRGIIDEKQKMVSSTEATV